MLRGALAAALTPLAEGGEARDEAAFEPYVDFLSAGGLDGLLALGTTGEGFLLPLDRRRRAAELFLEAAGDRLDVAVHCGAQSTADTVRLAAHAAEAGAAAVAVIAPPYFRLDDQALAAHLEAAAAACAPTPFYLYEFERVSGYAVPLAVVERLRQRVPNLAGMKVSDRPFDSVRPYLVEGLDVFVGAESLLHEGLAAGATGAVPGPAARTTARPAAGGPACSQPAGGPLPAPREGRWGAAASVSRPGRGCPGRGPASSSSGASPRRSSSKSATSSSRRPAPASPSSR